MSFKPDHKSLSFSDYELTHLKARNKTYNTLMKLDRFIDWHPVEDKMISCYPAGKKKKGPHAYPPLMLLKSLLLRNWFQISSDAELENQINDRISFKKFTGIPISDPAPDKSTFSRFRNRLTTGTYESLLSDISDQLSDRNIVLSMGAVRDIRIIKSGKNVI